MFVWSGSTLVRVLESMLVLSESTLRPHHLCVTHEDYLTTILLSFEYRESSGKGIADARSWMLMFHSLFERFRSDGATIPRNYLLYEIRCDPYYQCDMSALASMELVAFV